MKKIFYSLLTIISFILSFSFIINLKQANLFPFKIFLIITIILIILNVIALIGYFLKNKCFKILSTFLFLLIIVITITFSSNIKKTNTILNNAFEKTKEEITIYNIIVKNNTYQSLNELDNKKISYLNTYDITNIKTKLSNLYNYQLIPVDNLYSLYENLLSDESDVIIIDDAHLSILYDEYPESKNNMQVLTSFNITEKVAIPVKEATNLEPINIYISGSDSRENDIQAKSRSDVNILLTINPLTNKILITSIPRDYYVQIHNQKGLKDKLTHCGIYGMETSVKTLEDLFDIKIAYNLKVNFNSVIKIVDLIDGIDINSDKAFSSNVLKNFYIQEGLNHFNGNQALAYLRERYAYKEGDRHRIQNQQQVLKAIINKMLSDKKYLFDYEKILDILSDSYITDIPPSLIKTYIRKQLKEMPTWSFDLIWVNGQNASMPTFTSPKIRRYVMIPFDEDIKNAHDKIISTLNT
mgnify:FL=1